MIKDSGGIPSVQTDKKSLTLDDILSAEVKACEKALPTPPVKLKTPMRIPLEDFVRRSFMLHRHLFAQWNGWRFQGEPFMSEDHEMAEVVTLNEWAAFARQIGNLVRDKAIRSVENDAINAFMSLPDGTTLYAGRLLAQKTLLSRYLTRIDGIHGQQFCNLNKDYDYKIYVGRAYSASNQYGSYGKEIWAPVRVGQRLSAVVMRALEENEVSAPLKATWEKLFQRLGELAWGSQKTHIQTTLSIAPSSFIRLGTLGENSCYRHGGEGEYSKFWLAADCPDSFVALFHRRSTAPTVKVAGDAAEELPMWGDQIGIPTSSADPKSLNVCARAWGIASMGQGAMISNFYQLPREILMPSLLTTLNNALGIGADLEEHVPKMDNDGYTYWGRLMNGTGCVYLNKDVQLLCSKAGGKAANDLLAKYLQGVIGYAGAFGLYTRKGQGPTFLQVNDNVFRIAGPAASTDTSMWPYSDVNLKMLAEKAAESGQFLPSINPLMVGADPPVNHLAHIFNIPADINWNNVHALEDVPIANIQPHP